MRAAVSALFAIAAISALGCSPTLRDDVYACTTTSECPPGFQCIGDRCRNGLGTDCPSGRDSECFDNSECTRDLCESGFCTHRPETDAEGSPCEDGIFCNGPNQCSAGVCEASGVPPCPVCDEGSMGCVECGRLDMPCCDGGLCSDGVCDGLSICRACGGLGQPCCGDGTCDFGSSCDFITTVTCVTCGGSGEPCCLDPIGGFATCNVAEETCDFRVALPVCARCGHAGEPACASGCLEGVNVDGECTVRDCDAVGTECPADTVCAVDPSFPESPPFCAPCGTTGTYCCPGAASCFDPVLRRTECYFGFCSDGAVEG